MKYFRVTLKDTRGYTGCIYYEAQDSLEVDRQLEHPILGGIPLKITSVQEVKRVPSGSTVIRL